MAIGEYVDIDLYGRGFDGIYGYGAEKETKRQALMAFQARQRFQERVKPGEYIDLDLYGRGDPRIFGPGAHIQTRKEAQKHLEEAQRRKREGHVNAHAVVFPSGLKAIAKKASALLRRMSSTRTADPTKKEEPVPLDENEMQREVVVQHEEGLIPADEAGEIVEVFSQTEADEDGEIVEVFSQTEADEDGEIVEVFSKTEARVTIDNSEQEEIAEVFADKVVDRSSTAQETSGEAENIDRAPKRVKSKLPSEEPRPHVEKGHVARAIKSYSSLERGESQAEVVSRKSQPLAENRLAAFSSLPLHGTSSPEVSESGSSKEADKAETNSEESEVGEVREGGLPEPISLPEAARGVLVESDEEFQLSFSTHPDAIANRNNDNTSTSSEEDLLARDTQHDPIVIDEAGRLGTGGNKIAGLFRSDETDSGSDYDDYADDYADESHAPGGPSEDPEGTSSAVGERDISESIVEVQDVFIDDEGTEESSKEAVDHGAAKDDSGLMMDSRGDSIIHVIETPTITAQELVVGNVLLNDNETNEKETEEKGASMDLPEPESNDVAAEEAEQLLEQIVDTGSPSSNEKCSSPASDSDDSGGSYVDSADDDGEEGTDSDRSEEASSSVVVTSSAEEVEDSDEIEVDGVEEVEEEQGMAEQSDEEIVDLGDVRIVDSSDAESSSEHEDADGDDGSGEGADDGDEEGEDGQNKTFWQRMSLFGTVMSSSWIVF